jgi:hypothetical protein
MELDLDTSMHSNGADNSRPQREEETDRYISGATREAILNCDARGTTIVGCFWVVRADQDDKKGPNGMLYVWEKVERSVKQLSLSATTTRANVRSY